MIMLRMSCCIRCIFVCHLSVPPSPKKGQFPTNLGQDRFENYKFFSLHPPLQPPNQIDNFCDLRQKFLVGGKRQTFLCMGLFVI